MHVTFQGLRLRVKSDLCQKPLDVGRDLAILTHGDGDDPKRHPR